MRRVFIVFGREVRLSPRSPLVFFAIALPLLMTFLISAVFGGLFEASPSLGIVDEGDSALTVAALALDGVDTTLVDDEETLRRMVTDHDLDAGIVLGRDFDEELSSGAQPELVFLVSGESLASNRVVLAVTTLDLIRGISGAESPVAVAVTPIGEEEYAPVGDRLIPLVVMYAIVFTALFIPAASLVDEREKRTLDAVLVTPTKMSEILAGKALFATVLAVIMGLATLALNRAFAGQFWSMFLILVVGSVMLTLIGLILGLWSKDVNTLYTAVKVGGILIMLPAIFFLFPGLPQWIGKLAPTYYFLQPVYDIAVSGAGFGDVLPELAIAALVCVALVPIVGWVAKRTEHQLAITV